MTTRSVAPPTATSSPSRPDDILATLCHDLRTPLAGTRHRRRWSEGHGPRRFVDGRDGITRVLLADNAPEGGPIMEEHHTPLPAGADGVLAALAGPHPSKEEVSV